MSSTRTADLARVFCQVWIAGRWAPCSTNASKAIVRAVSAGLGTAAFGDWSYDLEHMLQKNMYGRDRPIRLRVDATKVEVEGYFEGPQGWTYSEETSNAVDTALSLGLLEVTVRPDNPDPYPIPNLLTPLYRVDLGNGVQTNLETQRKRRIRWCSPDPRDAGEEDENDEREEAAPNDLKCPITRSLMKHPVRASDGFVYEKEAIARWFEKHVTSPMTNATMPTSVIPCMATTEKIRCFKAAYRAAKATHAASPAGAEVAAAASGCKKRTREPEK